MVLRPDIISDMVPISVFDNHTFQNICEHATFLSLGEAHMVNALKSQRVPGCPRRIPAVSMTVDFYDHRAYLCAPPPWYSIRVACTTTLDGLKCNMSPNS